MPYVNIKITRQGVTIDEVDTDNRGIEGESVTARRRKGQ